jgi:hypothetical protein
MYAVTRQLRFERLCRWSRKYYYLRVADNMGWVAERVRGLVHGRPTACACRTISTEKARALPDVSVV